MSTATRIGWCDCGSAFIVPATDLYENVSDCEGCDRAAFAQVDDISLCTTCVYHDAGKCLSYDEDLEELIVTCESYEEA